MQWQFLSKNVPKTLEDLEQLMLDNRQITDPEAFFEPVKPSQISLKEVGIDPKQVRKAQKRILQAIEKKEQILVFGDYDADGICATAIMWEALYDLGAQVLPLIPHREKHGYGLTWAAIQELEKRTLPSLIVTVDTGIVAIEAVQDLVAKGVEVIITDHHQPEATLPEALAIVHSTAVSGAAVAWFLARELNELAVQKSLDLVGLATVSDMMPLQGINRSLVFHGLQAINKLTRLGLKALIKVANLQNKKIDAGMIGYTLAPRINAMGRLSHGLDALRLLCTTSETRAMALATIVDDTNLDRQQLTTDLMQIAKQQVIGQKKESLLIAHSADFHEGVIGLIAGKLANWYAKPVIVISTRGEVAKASARSVPGVNITELIRTARQYLLEVGGHPMAAGFGFEKNKLKELMAHLYEQARESIDPLLLQKTMEIECLLPFTMIDEKLVKMIQKFAPFGQANPEPVFALQDVKIAQVQTVGNESQHLKLTIQATEGGSELTALAWGKGELAINLNPGQLINVAGVLEANQWRERITLQLIIKDLQPKE
ncbi:MAG: single-stranded-DNA-specific exonuclease RecJ [Candidatus Pacebacteria bacterium RIFOXYB1_FULL_39_46]|nr:MAG: single-stranded-DNA-specific exonuclease RecJ [Candidatus Pacebacteria bacterium RIFOXYA1_FULL_38_18]OGJ37925.1 MAG: single-stranded-DNA-specific exonuclease RecJ [Candidatus Pacebacteria bacterium RIFOXYB1_FULL_39_46]OGJ39523.1 MAG: single-stranded-DNA-specific exonuclease RecJ [Candidatus Pacebacteria bacterium RIFOXYC1_FULL_39_21]OGJ40104.1 MAG: single-stranded-DNA-specific exonuclease RecJ [Candidatus Pacebacteria bacterium RIFOXYD1_FULL_39_27]